jgi:hypothetical protein
MSLFLSRKLLSIACCILLVGCGFQPALGTSSNLNAESPISAGVIISANTNRVISISENGNNSLDNSASASMSRQFTNDLEDMLNSTASPAYKLEVSITQSNAGLGVARDGTASRYNLIISSNYKLIRLSDNKVVDSGTITNFTSYNNPNNQYFSTYVSEQDARKRGITELAELYRHRLISFTEKN